MQRYVSETVSVYNPEEIIDSDLIDSKQYKSNLNKLAIVIALLSALCAIFIILSIRLYLKSRGYKDDDFN